LIIGGKAKFNFFNISNKEKFSFIVSAKDKKVVETIPGYAHSIVNIGNKKTQGIIWANEEYNSEQPDTYTLINEKI
jgi:UDP-2-acetamido-2,6-beta-L-arabino-hexul-4-ose reductase